MISTAERHLAKYPNARPSTVRQKEAVDAMCDRLARDIEAHEEKRVDDAIKAAFRPFAINVWAAEARSALGGGA